MALSDSDHPAAKFIVNYLRNRRNLFVGTRSATKLIVVASSDRGNVTEIRGRHAITGEPASVTLTFAEMRDLLARWESLGKPDSVEEDTT